MSVPPFNRSSGSDRTQPNRDEPEGKAKRPFQLPKGRSDQSVNQKGSQPQPNQQNEEPISYQGQPAQKRSSSSTTSKGDQKNNKGEIGQESSGVEIPQVSEKEEKEDGKKFTKKDKSELLQAELASQQQTQVFYSQADKGEISQIQKVEMGKVIAMIQKMVDQIATGQVGQTQHTTLQLKGADIPQLFNGATVNITQTERGLIIQFDKFQTPQQENAALNLVRSNQQALESLMRGLADRNMTIAQMNIGSHNIALPRIETPFLFQAPGSEQGGYQDQERQQREGRQQQEEEER